MQLKMTITQHTNSVNVLYDIKDILAVALWSFIISQVIGCQITAIGEIQNVLIPLLEQHPLQTSKFLNYKTLNRRLS